VLPTGCQVAKFGPKDANCWENIPQEVCEMSEFQDLPPAVSCRLIDFEDAGIAIGFVSGLFLHVSGTKPYVNMEVRLIPLVYIAQPEYWGIEVVGCLPGVALPADSPYTVSAQIGGAVGTRGIEVIGAGRSMKFEITGSMDASEAKSPQ
jgi:hypothetical protein